MRINGAASPVQRFDRATRKEHDARNLESKTAPAPLAKTDPIGTDMIAAIVGIKDGVMNEMLFGAQSDVDRSIRNQGREKHHNDQN